MEIEVLFVSVGLAVAMDYVHVNVQSIFLPVLGCGILTTFLKWLYIMVISAQYCWKLACAAAALPERK